MCGISGILSLNIEAANAQSVIESSLDTIKHRGPDHSGVLIDKSYALGHVRLSIIDLSPFSALRIVGLDGSLILTATITGYIMNESNLPELDLKVSHSLDIPAPNGDKYSLSVENAIRFDG